MLVAVKGNRETKITEDEKQSFLTDGCKILEVSDNGDVKVIADPSDSTKPSSEELKGLKETISTLQSEVSVLKGSSDAKDAELSEKVTIIAAKEQEIEELKAQFATTVAEKDAHIKEIQEALKAAKKDK